MIQQFKFLFMIHFSNTLIISKNLICDYNRLFHSSEILYSGNKEIIPLERDKKENSDFTAPSSINDSILEEKIKKLNLDEKEKLNDVSLTEDELNKLSDFSELLSSEKSISSSTTHANLSDSDNLPTISSFEESFPHFVHISDDLKKIMIKISESNDPSFKVIFEKFGFEQGIIHIIENYKVSGHILIQESIKSLESENSILRTDIEDIKKALESYNSENVNTQWFIDKSRELSNSLDRLSDLGMLTMQKYLDNKTIIDVGLLGISVISPILAYRGALNAYVRAMDPYNNKNILLKNEELLKKTAARQALVKKFNLVAIPLITCFAVLGLNSIRKIQIDININSDVNTNPKGGDISNNSNSNTSLSGLLTLKSYMRSPTFIYSLSMLSLNFLMIPYIKKHYPLVYIGIIDHFSNNYSYYLLFTLSWPLIVTLYNIIELYFYSIHCNSSTELKLPKYLPFFLRKTYTNLYTISKSEEKLNYTNMLFKNVIFGLVLSIVCFFAVYFFL